MSNLYCDNYATCNSYVYELASTQATTSKARAAGWHIFTGTTVGGKSHQGVLCPKCVGPNRPRLSPAPNVMDGQESLFSTSVEVMEQTP